jgi:hypothetical protein
VWDCTQPAVELDDGTWYWISLPRGARTWPANPGQRVRIRYVHGDQFCEVVEEAADVVFTRALVGRHVMLAGRRAKIVDAGAERTDDKGYRVIRVEMAGGNVCDLLAPVETLD